MVTLRDPNRVTLAPLTLEELEHVRHWRNAVLETLRTPYLLTAEMQTAFYEQVITNRNSPHRYYALLAGDTLVGMGGLTNIQWENGLTEISLIIDPNRAGGGYGRQAVRALLTLAFHGLRLETVFGECYHTNDRGLHFWTKIVAEYKGESTTLYRRKFWGGRLWDAYYFSVAREQFEQRLRDELD